VNGKEETEIPGIGTFTTRGVKFEIFVELP